MRIEHFGMFQMSDEQLKRAGEMKKQGLSYIGPAHVAPRAGQGGLSKTWGDSLPRPVSGSAR